jgi:hypothetical protein
VTFSRSPITERSQFCQKTVKLDRGLRRKISPDFNANRKEIEMSNKYRFSAIAVVFSGLVFAITSSASSDGQSITIDLAFKSHLDMGLAEQDVFIERQAGTGEVFRVTNGDNNMNAELFKTATPVAHDPFNADAVGPFPKGESTGLTLGQWLRHQGKGTYSCEANEGKLDISFSGLVPNGVYTMWHAFMAVPPPVPFTGTLDLPLGARDGSESAFVADADGAAAFLHTFTPCLQMSDVWTTSMLAINWHSDGKTYGGHPGRFGSISHIPLFVMLPPREGI